MDNHRPLGTAFWSEVFKLILAALTGGFVSWFVNCLSTPSTIMVVPILGFIVSLALQVYLFYRSAKRTNNEKSHVIQLERAYNDLVEHKQFLTERLHTATSEMGLLGRIFHKNAESLNKVAEQIIYAGKYEEQLWNFQKTCDSICESMLTVLQTVSFYGGEFSASYIACKKSLRGSMGKAQKSTAYMIGYADSHGERPTVYYPNKIPKKYFSKTLFNQKHHDIVILGSNEEIQKRFHFLNDYSKDKYSQYIGIPVFCDGNKMVGLIELIALNSSIIALNSNSDLLEIAETFFRPYAHLFLLMDKIEKAMLAHPEENGS